MNVQIRYQNGTLTVCVSGQQASPTGGNAGDSPVGGSSGGVLSGCGGIVVGPIVLPLGSQGSATGGNAGDSPVGGNAGDSPVGGSTGGGSTAGGNSSGCGCPIVIGPIVFTNCSGAAATATAPLQTVNISNFIPMASEIAAGPPATTPFNIEQQQEAEWCWAAVAVSVHNYFTSSSTLQQAKLVAELSDIVCDAVPNPHDPCNQPNNLDGPLSTLGNLVQPNGGQFDSIVKFADLQKYWNAAPFPICIRIVWDDGIPGAHFIALTANVEFSNGQQLVSVHDPSAAAFGPAQWDYDSLRLHYQGPPATPNQLNPFYPSGHWNDTYFVQP